ncbi:MAG: hypothetical protein WAZ31_10890 [Rectinemataceae bacterium]
MEDGRAFPKKLRVGDHIQFKDFVSRLQFLIDPFCHLSGSTYRNDALVHIHRAVCNGFADREGDGFHMGEIRRLIFSWRYAHSNKDNFVLGNGAWFISGKGKTASLYIPLYHIVQTWLKDEDIPFPSRIILA